MFEEIYGYKVVTFDGTHGSKPYDFILHTMLAVDMQNEGVPVAFLISNRVDRDVIKMYSFDPFLRQMVKYRQKS